MSEAKMMTQEWNLIRDNVRQVVDSLEVCWKCQHVSQCEKYVIGNIVLVWLCKGCKKQIEQPRPRRSKRPQLELQAK